MDCLPLLALAALYVLPTLALRVFEAMNDRRDRVLDPDDGRWTLEHRRLMYGDWMLLMHGVWAVWLCLMGGVIFWTASRFLDSDPEPLVCLFARGLAVAVLVLVAVLGHVSGRTDRTAMGKRLAEMEGKERR